MLFRSRNATSDIQAIQNEFLNSRLKHQQKIFRNSISANSFAIIFAIIVAGLSYFTISRDLNRRKTVEEDLRESLIRLAKKSRYERVVGTVIQGFNLSENLRDILENAAEIMSRNMDKVDFCSFYIIEGEQAVLKAKIGRAHV